MANIIGLNSVRNFRDFGGYNSENGSRLSPGKLYRSAHFSDVDDTDLDFLKRLDIGLLVDLRYSAERRRQPNKVFLSAKGREIALGEDEADIILETPKFAPHEMFMKEALHTASDAREYMINSYRTRPHDRLFINIFSRTLKFMAQNAGTSILIHCAAGKDRTGTLAAIIQKLLGVNDEDILVDYMKTLEAVNVEKYLEPASVFMSKKFGRNISPEALRPMFGVEPAYLEASLTAIGDFEFYCHHVLGLTAREKQQLFAYME